MIERQWQSATTTGDGGNNHKEYNVGGQPVKLFSTLSWVIKVKDNSERYCWLTYEKRPNGGHSPIGHQQVFRPARIRLWEVISQLLSAASDNHSQPVWEYIFPLRPVVARRTLLPFTMKANKFCGFVKWGPQGGTRRKSGLWVFVSSSPLQNTGARECEQSNQATVSRTNSLTH